MESGVCFNQFSFVVDVENGIKPLVGAKEINFDVGVSPVQEGPGVFKFDRAINYFGFLWGSVDKHNMVDLYNKGELVHGFTGGSFIPNTGDQSASIYVSNFGVNDHFFNEIRFSTNQNAFEIDNAGYGTVPVPATLP